MVCIQLESIYDGLRTAVGYHFIPRVTKDIHHIPVADVCTRLIKTPVFTRSRTDHIHSSFLLSSEASKWTLTFKQGHL